MILRPLITLMTIGLALTCVSPALAVYREDFESPEPTWRLADSDTTARITYQQRNFEQFHSGNGSEQVQILAGRGTYVRLALAIEPTRIIGELQPTLWLKADRAGIQLMLRVVLPRSRDPRTGLPLTAFLYGDSYHQVGVWQQLGLANVVKELQQQERVLRSNFKEVDAREAYIDLVVLNAYGGPGLTTLWIDELVIRGHAPLTETPAAADEAPFVAQPARYPVPPQPNLGLREADTSVAVELRGSVLLVDGRPFMPRMIDHNGEPLSWLKSLGFNTIKLRATPTSEQLAAAEEHDLWLVAPPPQLETGQRIGSHFQRVLAWSLGQRLGPRDVSAARQSAAEVRAADDRLRRLLVCSAAGELWAYSQLADAVIVDQPVLGTSFPLGDFEPWLRQRRRLMRSETPLWTAVQTEAAPELQTQIDQLSGGAEPLMMETSQIRLLAYAAIAAGSRGVHFRSHSALNASTAVAERRARALQLINAELRVLEPWSAGGSPGPSVTSGDPNVRIASLQTERSQMLLVSRVANDQQYVASVPSTDPIHFVVPGATGAGDVFQVTTNGLFPLNHRRGAGGTRVVVDNLGLATLVLVAREQLVLTHVAQAVSESSREFPRWRFEEAKRQFDEVQLARTSGTTPPELQRLGRTIELYLTEAERVLSSGDGPSADRYLVRAESALTQVRRSAWEQAAAAFPAPVSSPLCISHDTLPLHWQLSSKLRKAQWGSNLLAGGNFEDMNHTLSSGWQQDRRDIEHVATAAEFSLESPQSGRSCLRLQAWATNPQAAPTVLESAPLWITSSPVRIEQGQLVRIHGWVRVPQPIQASYDGLLIFDSFGALPLATRIQQTDGWREFVLYRVAPQASDLRVTFALTGLGEAWLDGVTITALPPYAAR